MARSSIKPVILPMRPNTAIEPLAFWHWKTIYDASIRSLVVLTWDHSEARYCGRCPIGRCTLTNTTCVVVLDANVTNEQVKRFVSGEVRIPDPPPPPLAVVAPEPGP